METKRHEPLVLTKAQEDIIINELGVTRQMIYHWKTGNARPRPKIAKKISMRFGMDFETLVDAD